MEKKLLIMAICVVVVIGLVTTVGMAGPRATKACRDSVDNDGDGYTDWPDDPGCLNKNDDSELNPSIECDDGSDNDGDSATDMDDTGCSSPTDNDETDCGDGICEGGEVCDVCVADCGYCGWCSDTDGGFNIEVKGTVTGYDGSPYNYTDYCVDSTHVMEYYCVGDHCNNFSAECWVNNQTAICVDGACTL